MTLITSNGYTIAIVKKMKKTFIRVLSGLFLQMIVVASVHAQSTQSTLVLPELVEPGENFTISWPAWTFREFRAVFDDDAANFERELSYKLERYDGASSSWVSVFVSPSGRSYVENVAEEGVYEYRLTREVEHSEDEDDDDGSYTNYSEDDIVEFPLTIIVASLTPEEVLCSSLSSAGCISIQTPQGFSAERVGESLSARISWLAETGTDRYELERFNNDYDQWEIVYAGNQLTHNYSGLEPGFNQFRIRACKKQLCGDPSLSQSVETEFVNVVKHQCEPVL